MKKRVLLLMLIFMVMASSCGLPRTELQIISTPVSSTSNSITVASPIASTSTPEFVITKGVYENSAFSFTIPDRWKEIPSSGEYYDLGVEELLTIRSESTPTGFFTIASVPLAAGESLQSRLDQAYIKGPQIENVSTSPLERTTFSGIEITYDRPWGEPWWSFRDIWLEKTGVIYVLSFHSYRGTNEKHTQTFDSILESFSLK